MANINKLKNSKLHEKLKEYMKIGKISSEELDKIIPENTNHEIVKEVISFLKESGIAIINKEAESEINAQAEQEEEFESTSTENIINKFGNDDPVRMYLKEMGYRLLLTRDGEVEVAKRIEKSRINKLFYIIQTPMALKKMQDWYDDILTGKKLLREVIDIDATASNEQFFDENSEKTDDFNTKNTESGNDDFDNDDDSDSTSISAIENDLKPKILDILLKISKNCKSLLQLYDIKKDKKISSSNQSKTKKKLLDNKINDIANLLGELKLNDQFINEIFYQLKEINKDIIQIESELFKLASNSKLNRTKFIDVYRTIDLEKNWIDLLKNRGVKYTKLLDEIARFLLNLN